MAFTYITYSFIFLLYGFTTLINKNMKDISGESYIISYITYIFYIS